MYIQLHWIKSYKLFKSYNWNPMIDTFLGSEVCRHMSPEQVVSTTEFLGVNVFNKKFSKSKNFFQKYFFKNIFSKLFFQNIFSKSLCHCVTVSACPRVRVSACPRVRVSGNVYSNLKYFSNIFYCVTVSLCPRVRVSACPRVRVSTCPKTQTTWQGWHNCIFYNHIYDMEYSEDTVHSIILCINTVVVKCVFYWAKSITSRSCTRI